MAHTVARQAEFDLDEIWLYVAMESSSLDIATELVDSLTARFSFLAGFPFAGRGRDSDMGPGIRSFVAGDYLIVYSLKGDEIVILRVVHGNRFVPSLFAQ